jgi:plasmid maintenance system antidote protein VapI
MRHPKQAKIHPVKILRKRMIDLDCTYKDLATKTGFTRESISRAVNHGRNPGVLSRVKEVLGV